MTIAMRWQWSFQCFSNTRSTQKQEVTVLTPLNPRQKLVSACEYKSPKGGSYNFSKLIIRCCASKSTTTLHLLKSSKVALLPINTSYSLIDIEVNHHVRDEISQYICEIEYPKHYNLNNPVTRSSYKLYDTTNARYVGICTHFGWC
jgi:hypothetical protein